MNATILLKTLIWFWVAFHPYYLSVTEIEYDSRTGMLGMSCKFFTDDLEEALKAGGNSSLDLVRGDSVRNAKLMSDYVKRHLKVTVDGREVEMRFIGFENGPEATWCYFEQGKMTAPRTLRVEADLLYETKREQINLFHLRFDGSRRSWRLANPERSFEAVFK